ncbi:hypothetical protein SETIT_6G197100v2 [Setaria italica]|uniref:Uncharacterized protein n=2 Tax=Setaria TaxID=4554 RepID=A0A368RNH7_SETIT|nr:hypothetical protein SETIT_6G197100v2 [Setaria italica]TKW10989.1 hypothetical protein SEVIR_6G204500v2 [Setaria viridis]
MINLKFSHKILLVDLRKHAELITSRTKNVHIKGLRHWRLLRSSFQLLSGW